MTTMSELRSHPSPNFGERRGGARPDMVVLHYTGMASAEAALARLSDPSSRVSAHYFVDADGTTFALVSEECRAWHAGFGSWGGAADVNSRSIGIELVNPGHDRGYLPFPEPQMAALERLLRGILARRNIPPERVVGHACVAPGRKIDPGEKFDWRRLALQGLSVWLEFEEGDLSPPPAARFLAAARRIGYGAPEGDEWNAPALAIWRSFVMRFVPGVVGAPPRADAVGHAAAIAARWPALESSGDVA